MNLQELMRNDLLFGGPGSGPRPSVSKEGKVTYEGVHIGNVTPTEGRKDTSQPGSRIADTRSTVTRHAAESTIRKDQPTQYFKSRTDAVKHLMRLNDPKDFLYGPRHPSNLHAGGPGSGRHKEYGQFQKGKSFGVRKSSYSTYTAPSGTQVHVNERATKDGNHVGVSHVEPESFEAKHVFQGPKAEAQKILKDSYGISYKGRAPQEVLDRKASQRLNPDRPMLLRQKVYRF